MGALVILFHDSPRSVGWMHLVHLESAGSRLPAFLELFSFAAF